MIQFTIYIALSHTLSNDQGTTYGDETPFALGITFATEAEALLAGERFVAELLESFRPLVTAPWDDNRLLEVDFWVARRMYRPQGEVI